MTDHDTRSPSVTRCSARAGLGRDGLAAGGRDPRAAAAIQSVLVPGEQLLWYGRPGIRYRLGEDVGCTIGAVVAVAFALAFRHSGSAVFFGVLIGACLLWSLVRLPWERATHVYGVTDRRVLFVHRSWRTWFDEYRLIAMSAAKIEVSANTVGFANFAQRCGYDKQDLCMPEFRGLSDAPEVGLLIRDAVTAANEMSPLRPDGGASADR